MLHEPVNTLNEAREPDAVVAAVAHQLFRILLRPELRRAIEQALVESVFLSLGLQPVATTLAAQEEQVLLDDAETTRAIRLKIQELAPLVLRARDAGKAGAFALSALRQRLIHDFDLLHSRKRAVALASALDTDPTDSTPPK